MKTWQMIKELTENPDKKFISKNADLEFIAEVNSVGLFVIKCKDGFIQNSFDISRDWEEVKESVPFMEAFEALRNKNKNIYCVYGGAKNHYYHNSRKDYFFHEDYIGKGKWYIED